MYGLNTVRFSGKDLWSLSYCGWAETAVPLKLRDLYFPFTAYSCNKPMPQLHDKGHELVTIEAETTD